MNKEEKEIMITALRFYYDKLSKIKKKLEKEKIDTEFHKQKIVRITEVMKKTKDVLNKQMGIK